MPKLRPQTSNVLGVDNAELADWIKRELPYDQLILEFYTPGEPNSGWIHCSYTEGMPRKQFLHAYRKRRQDTIQTYNGKSKRFIYLNPSF